MNTYDPIVLTEENDRTGALKKARLIRKMIVDKPELLNDQKILALYGGWGSGKSSVVETLINKESKLYIGSNYKSILFEAWEYEKDDNLSLSLFERLLEEKSGIKNQLEKEVKTLFSVIKGAAKGVTLTLPMGVAEVGVNTEKVFEEIDKIEEEYKKRSYHSARKELSKSYEKLIKEIKGDNKKVVVFIDDLDRCENENVLHLITSLKHLFSMSDDIIFIVTIDKNAVTQALKVKYGNESEKAEEYLEKVFPLSLALTEILDYNKYLDEFDIGRDYEELRDTLKKTFEKYRVTTPRKILRIWNKLKILTELSEVLEKIEAINDKAMKNEEVNNYFLTVIFVIVLSEYSEKNYYNFLENYNSFGNFKIDFGVDRLTEKENEKAEITESKANSFVASVVTNERKDQMIRSKNPIYNFIAENGESFIKYKETVREVLEFL